MATLSATRKSFRKFVLQNHPIVPFLRHFSSLETIKASPSPPSNTNSDLHSVLELLRNKDWNEDLEKTLPNLLSSLTPSQLLSVIQRLDDSNKALSFFEFTRRQNLPKIHAPSAYQIMFEIASKEAQPHLKMRSLLHKSKEQGFLFNQNSAILLINCFGRAGLVRESLEVFNEVRTRIRTRKPFFYNTMLNVLVKSDHVGEALELVYEMIDSDCFIPDYVTFSIVFSGLIKKNRIDTGFDFVHKMGKRGIFPDAIHLTQLISKLCKSGAVDKAWEIIHGVKKMGGRVEVPSFNALLTCLGLKCDFSRMNLLMGEMKQMGIKPNVITFGIVINTLCKSHRMDEALQVLENMINKEEPGLGAVAPDVITFNTVIDGLCKVGRPEEGFSLMGRMKEQGCCPNTVTYNCLIDGFSKTGQIERSHQLFLVMVDEGIPPSVITLNAMINAMCMHGRISGALEFLRDMQAKGLKCNAATYNTLISSFCGVNNVCKALELFEEMKRSNYASPDAVTYYTLILGLSQADNLDGACGIASKMQEEGLLLDVASYNVLINGFCKRGELDKAYEMLQEMERVGVKSDEVTFNTLVSALSKGGDFSTAHEMVSKMIDEGFVPSTFTYGSLINGYCKAGDLDEAMKLITEMRRRGIYPNTVIYTILIDYHCKRNDIDAALSLMDEMVVKEVIPSVVTYNTVFKVLQKKNMLTKAYELMDGMEKQGCSPDYITLEILTEWLPAAGGKARLRSFVKENDVCVSNS